MKQEYEFAYYKSRLLSAFKAPVSVLPYTPGNRQPPPRRLPIRSAWTGHEEILADLIQRFQLRTDRCLEFGVEYGFSTVALSSYFDSVIGVDTFQGDRHTNNIQDIYTEALENTAPYPNVQLIRSDYQTFTKTSHGTFGLIHVDIIHTFADTFACGLWSANHSQCTIFHDTESFPAVKQAVREVARATGKKFYNFPESYGLGIVV